MRRVTKIACHRGRVSYSVKVTPSTPEEEKIAIEMKNISVLGEDQEAKKKKKTGDGAAANSGDNKEKNNNNNNKKESEEEEMKEKKEEENKTVAAAGGGGGAAASSQTNEEEDEKPKKQVIARDLHCTIPKGKLTLVVGGTASGKSLLVKALVGEADVERNREDSSLKLFTTLSLCEQEAWIMNATVKENILMGSEYDEERYNRIVDVCQLRPDFGVLPAADETEIGAKGVNLSGGQKSRVSLCRAAYSNRNTIVADDVLAAVDPHVSVALFDKCICGELSDRTRVLVTHQTHLIPRADYVIVMEKQEKTCVVAFAGTVDELRVAPNINMEIPDEYNSPTSEDKKKTTDDDQAPAANKAGGGAVAGPPEKKQPQAVDGKLIEKEVDNVGIVTSDTYFWYFSLGGVGIFFWTCLFGFLSSASSVLSSLTLSMWTMGATNSTRLISVTESFSNDDFMMYMGIFTVIGMIFLLISKIFFVSFILNVARSAHGALVTNLMRCPMTWFDINPVGRILVRLTKDT